MASAGTATSARSVEFGPYPKIEGAGRRRRGPAPAGRLALLPHDANLVVAGRGSDVDLGVTIVRVAPAPAFEQSMRSGDAAERNACGQIAARLDHATPALAHVQGFSARMLACRGTMAGTDAIHEQHSRAVIVFQVVNVGLKSRGIRDADTSLRACLERDNNADRPVAVCVERARR